MSVLQRCSLRESRLYQLFVGTNETVHFIQMFLQFKQVSIIKCGSTVHAINLNSADRLRGYLHETEANSNRYEFI